MYTRNNREHGVFYILNVIRYYIIIHTNTAHSHHPYPANLLFGIIKNLVDVVDSDNLLD